MMTRSHHLGGPLSPPAHGDVRPGSLRAGQALSPVDDTQLPEVDPTVGVTVPFIPAVVTGQPEIYSADRAVFEPTTPDPGPVSSVTARPRVGDFVHLSGSALCSAFSKALMRSQLSAAGKARILTEVTSITERDMKDRLRREWLERLQ
ncbi:MAG TPA: hypothetical protein VE954_34970 [Oligoflexus sp.]|uniref:hypothetical protein n=1 Tax=Oligoflexus sp. TaxID=1971216 RepID=UPI002D43DA60|nr:hypothetical protein [Oligoflexus sp.]HYX38334.1 hypothetical protein [Oligoflexus sp.]